MQFEIIPVTQFQQNCSLIICPETRRAAFVDPGGDLDELQAHAEHAGVTIEKILLTHGHIDHCGQAGLLAQRLGVPIEGPHRDDAFWIDQLKTQGVMFGFGHCDSFTPDRWLVDGDTVTVGNQTMSVIHCQGTRRGMWCLFTTRTIWPSWAMCCLRGRLAGRIFRVATIRT
jgi:glyoxylase-like metal-dependent hydrolase (beta-lactamase superfamily II)